MDDCRDEWEAVRRVLQSVKAVIVQYGPRMAKPDAVSKEVQDAVISLCDVLCNVLLDLEHYQNVPRWRRAILRDDLKSDAKGSARRVSEALSIFNTQIAIDTNLKLSTSAALHQPTRVAPARPDSVLSPPRAVASFTGRKDVLRNIAAVCAVRAVAILRKHDQDVDGVLEGIEDRLCAM